MDYHHKEFAETAREEGFEELAKQFEEVAGVGINDNATTNTENIKTALYSRRTPPHFGIAATVTFLKAQKPLLARLQARQGVLPTNRKLLISIRHAA